MSYGVRSSENSVSAKEHIVKLAMAFQPQLYCPACGALPGDPRVRYQVCLTVYSWKRGP